MAKAVASHTYSMVYGKDSSDEVLSRAIDEGIVSGKLEDHFEDIDILIVAVYPSDVVDIISKAAEKLRKGCTVIDCTGIKQAVCAPLSGKLSKMGLNFIGGHPMAGKEVSGYNNSGEDLFAGASMILCRDEYTDEKALSDAADFFKDLGFTTIKITTAKEHDRVIAYTSQLAHIVSSAYIKSPTLDERYGFSAGSFKDMTRVAKLNEEMWADLFLANDEAISDEIDELVGHLMEYASAIEGKDRDRLVKLLRDGRIRKEEDERSETLQN